MPAHSSGNLMADKRYAYGQALLKEGDAAGASDLFAQALELAPQWAPALFGLGEALERAGQSEAAIIAYRQALRIEPDDALGAGLRLARLGAADPVDAMRPGYVAALFDEYAPRFDEHLRGMLAYRGPEIILAALAAAFPDGGAARRFDAVLDLGCGTGLMAEAMVGRAMAIDGVDLSPAMVERAASRGIYRELIVDDAAAAMAALADRTPPMAYDLILAADVLVYVGDLGPLLRAAARVSRPTAPFAFTVQRHEGEAFVLGPDLRYHHSRAHIEARAAAAGFRLRHAEPCVTRMDAGAPVPGDVIVLERTGG